MSTDPRLARAEQACAGLLIHGPAALERAEQASAVLFGGEITGLSAAEIQDIFAEVPSSEVSKYSLEGKA